MLEEIRPEPKRLTRPSTTSEERRAPRRIGAEVYAAVAGSALVALLVAGVGINMPTTRAAKVDRVKYPLYDPLCDEGVTPNYTRDGSSVVYYGPDASARECLRGDGQLIFPRALRVAVVVSDTVMEKLSVPPGDWVVYFGPEVGFMTNIPVDKQDSYLKNVEKP